MKYGRKISINIYNYLSTIYNILPYSFNINTIRLINQSMITYVTILIFPLFLCMFVFQKILFMFDKISKIIFIFVFYTVHKNMIYGFVNLLFLFY